jgi:hypothetical protein
MYDDKRDCFTDQEASETMMLGQDILPYHVTTENVDLPVAADHEIPTFLSGRLKLATTIGHNVQARRGLEPG